MTQTAKRRMLAVIEQYYPYNVYVDESMQSRYGLNVTGVAAYVATLDQWLKFEEEWNGILRRFEIPLDGHVDHSSPYFHMTDFIARKAQFQNDWTNDRRDEFMERLMMTASEWTTVGIAVSVDDEQFRKALPDDIRGFWRKPYFFCVWGILRWLSNMEEQFRISLPKPLWFLFDPRQKARQFAGDIFYTVKTQATQAGVFGEMGFGELWRTSEIQAADLLVYEAVRHMIETRRNSDASIRKSLQTLGRKKNPFYDRA